MQRRRFFGIALSFALSLSGCGAGTAANVPPGTMTPATSVEASFLSASLSDDCPGSSGTGAARAPAADCAAPADAGAGLVPGGGGCGYCRQSSMQLRFVASAGETPAYVEVTTVRLLDASTGAVLDTLTARDPTSWEESSSTYRPWNRNVSPQANLRVSWKLSAPRWNSFAGESASNRSSYNRRFRIEVVLRVDGVERTVRSGELNREAEVVT